MPDNSLRQRSTFVSEMLRSQSIGAIGLPLSGYILHFHCTRKVGEDHCASTTKVWRWEIRKQGLFVLVEDRRIASNDLVGQ